MSKKIPSSPENAVESSGMLFHIPKINKAKLATELKASPKDFSKTRKEFKEWFEKTFKFEYGEVDPEKNEKPLLHVKLSPNSRAILDVPDARNLFLYLKDMPAGINEKEFLIFLSLYQQAFQIQALEDKARILSDTGPDQEERLAMFESQNIILTLMQLQKMPPMKLPEFLKEKLRKVPDIDEDGSLRQNEEIWSRRRPGIGMLFIDNIVSREQPEHDIPYLDELLCYHESIFFSTLISTSRKIPLLWGFWMIAHWDHLINTESETYKLFCGIFNIPEGKIYEEDGSIRPEVSLTIPHDLEEALGILEIRKQESVGQKRMQENNKKRLEEILSNPLGISCDDAFILSAREEIPPEIKRISITIRRNHKAIARASFAPQELPLDLKQCSFETFQHPAKEKNISWSQLSQWKGGETHTLEAEGSVGNQNGAPAILHTWKAEKTRRETPIPEHKYIPKHSPIITKTPTVIRNILQPQENVSTSSPLIESTQPSLDPKESEKEDLKIALELLLLEKSPEALQSLLVENTLWDKENKTLTLTIPISELEEMGYTPSVLSAHDYGPLTQWVVRKEKDVWVPDGKEAPEIIRMYYEYIYLSLSQNIERGEIDNYLSECGLSPSDTSDNSTLRGAIHIGENIDIKALMTGIKKMSEKYIQEGAQFNLYYGPLSKDGSPTSISWFSKKQWRATLTLQPTIKIDLTPSGDQSLPYDASLMSQRIENALLNFVYQFIKNVKGVSGIIKRTSAQEDTKRLRESYRRELKKKTARLLIENADGITFTIIEGISKKGLEEAILNAQKQYGVENVGLLYRRNTYTFLGDRSICKPSQSRSDEDYISLALPERRNIIRERVLKSLFNGKSGVQDRAPFLYGSAVYHALQFEAKAFQEQNGRDISREDITDEFLEKFIAILRSGQILISYRDYCAGEVEDLTDLVAE